MKTFKRIAPIALVIGLIITLLWFVIPVGAQEHQYGDELTKERGRSHRVYYVDEATKVYEFFETPEYTISIADGSWVEYGFSDYGDFYSVQHPWFSVAFYDYYTVVYDETFTEIKIYDDRWVVEYWTGKKWSDTGLWDVTRSYEIVDDGIKLKRTGTTTIGQREEIYYFRNGSPCKIEIRQDTDEAQTIRFVWKPSGIVASGERNTIVDEAREHAGKTYGLNFYNEEGNRVHSLRWYDELATTESIVPVTETSAGGRKATVTFANFESSAGDTVVLDPETYYPDAHVETNTVDGYLEHYDSGATWVTIQGGAGTTFNDDGDTMWARITGSAGEGTWGRIRRGAALWNTANLSDIGIITLAQVSLYGVSRQQTAPNLPAINIYSFNPNSDTALIASDYTDLGTTQYATSLYFGDWTNGVYNTLTLNSAGIAAISRDGITRFGFREAVYDATAEEPTWCDMYLGYGFHTSDKGAGFKPKLVVTIVIAPTVTTQAATNIEDTTATGNGNITNLNGAGDCDMRGMVWDLASHGDPGVSAPGASGYANVVSENGTFGTGAFTANLTGLATGDTIYARAFAHNANAYAYGGEVSFLTKPAAPTNVDATDSTHSDKVVITWTKSTGATGYKVYEGVNLLDTLGDVATYDDEAAPEGTIDNSGNVTASDGSSSLHVTLSLANESTTAGAPRTYKVVALNATGDSDDSTTNAGNRGAGTITYQWQRSAADSDADYGNIAGGTTDPYNDTGAPVNGDGRYYQCIVSSVDASNSPQTSDSDRGYRLGLPIVTTQAATDIEDTTATGNGNITNVGGDNATIRGIVWDLSSHGDPGNVSPAVSDYANDVDEVGDFGTGAFTESLTSLPTGDTIYARAYACNSIGYAYGEEVNFLTKPAAPTNVAAEDGVSTENVTITWTKSTGATGYKVYEGVNLLDTLGDVATFDDTTAPAGIVTPGTASATDGTETAHVVLSVAGESVADGATRTYKVVATNTTGDSDDSDTDTGYRTTGSLTYAWQRSAGDSDASYSTLGGATTDPYNDSTASAGIITPGTATASDGTSLDHITLSLAGESVADGAGKWYYCEVSATGTTTQDTTHNRGYRGTGALTYAWQRSAADSDGSYGDIGGGTTDPYNDTGAPSDGSGRYARCRLNATGTAQQISSVNRGYRGPPQVPTEFESEAVAEAHVDLTWTKGLCSSKTYIVRKAGSYPEDRSDGLNIYFGTGTEFSDSGLETRTAYYYVAWSHSTGPNDYSTTRAETAVAIAHVIPTVTIRDATRISRSTARLNAFLNEDGGADCEARFEWDVDSGIPYANETDWVSGYTTNQAIYSVIESLTPGQLYYFRVRVRNDAGTTVGLELDFRTQLYLGDPTDLLAQAISAYAISLTWVSGEGSTQSIVRYDTGGYPALYTDGDSAYAGMEQTCLVEDLDPGTTYYFRVWAEDGGQYSPDYAYDLATTLAGFPTVAGPDDVTTDERWWQETDSTTLQYLPIYVMVNNFSGAFGWSNDTGWMVLTLIIITALGFGIYQITHSGLITIIVVCFGVVVACIMHILPMWVLAPTAVLGGGAIFIRGRL